MTREEIDTLEPEPISPQMDALACALIDYSLDLLSETGELAPTLAAEDEQGNRSLLSFDDEDVEECLEEVRDLLVAAAEGVKALEGLTGRPVRYAVAYDGAVALPGDPGDFGDASGLDDASGLGGAAGDGYEDALIVEYGEHGMSSAYSAYLLYSNAGNPQEFVCTEPAAAGEGELLV